MCPHKTDIPYQRLSEKTVDDAGKDQIEFQRQGVPVMVRVFTAVQVFHQHDETGNTRNGDGGYLGNHHCRMTDRASICREILPAEKQTEILSALPCESLIGKRQSDLPQNCLRRCRHRYFGQLRFPKQSAYVIAGRSTEIPKTFPEPLIR